MSHYSTLIHSARVIDGTGNPWFYADVALQGDQISAIAPPGSIEPASAETVVDATDMVVCPGFIDILSHSILSLMRDGRSLSKITQGVTTEIMGEGWTPAPFQGLMDMRFIERSPMVQHLPEWKERIPTWSRFGDWLDAMIDHGVSPNIGSFLGGGGLRIIGMGMEMRPPTDDEMATMRRVTAESMEDGAFGVSEALIYPPSAYKSTDEVVEICKVVGEHDGVYITHLRSEADTFIEAFEEALEIGRRADVPIEVYHLKAAGQRNWHKAAQIIERINGARASGQDVTADLYPYTGAGTGLSSVLPPWASANNQFFENLRDPNMRAKIRAEALSPSGDWEAMADLCGPEGVMPIGLIKTENQQYVGRTLSEIGDMRNQEWVDAAFDLFLSEEQRISAIYFMMDEDNIRMQLQQPWITVGTDAGGLDPTWAKPMGPYHPRAYGSYTRILGKYVRDEGIIPLEDAVRKMSSAVANRLGIRRRGLLREGFFADVVIFDPETIGDRATFTDPHQLSVGVRHVWINGDRVLVDGEHTGATPGQIVRRNQ
jgi:N-acyl-D-amino-acid deacylase